MSSTRKIFTAVLVGGVLALSTVAGALANHPGHNDNPDHEMPQGPNVIACENNAAPHPSGKGVDVYPPPGDDGWGVYNAIARGGMVHCAPVDDE